MFVSIIIPYYKRMKELLCTLDSLNEQSFRDFEVVVVNDGSQDIENLIIEKRYTIDIVYKYYPRTERSGRAFARNMGIKDASGELLIFLDCDQLVNKQFVENHVMAFQSSENKKLLQYGTRKYLADFFDENYSSIDEVPYIPDNRLRVIGNDYFSAINTYMPWCFVYSHNMSIMKSDVEKYGGFNEAFKGWGLEDTEFAYRMHKNGVQPLFNADVESYSQFDLKRIDEVKKFNEWKYNYNVIIDIHPDPIIYFQSIFDDYYNIEQRKKIRKQGVADVGLYCYVRFDELLKAYSLNPEKEFDYDDPRFSQYISEDTVLRRYMSIEEKC